MENHEGILLVDDDDVFRGRLAKALSDRNHEVFEAKNSSEALASLKKNKIKKVVLDLRLEKEHGLDLLPELKKIDSEVRVLILTGYGTIGTAVDAVKRGAYNYLSKPVNADAILHALSSEGEAIVIKNPETQRMPELEQVEWDYINRILTECSGNISKAAKVLGIHRRSLQRKLSKAPQSLK